LFELQNNHKEMQMETARHSKQRFNVILLALGISLAHFTELAHAASYYSGTHIIDSYVAEQIYVGGTATVTVADGGVIDSTSTGVTVCCDSNGEATLNIDGGVINAADRAPNDTFSHDAIDFGGYSTVNIYDGFVQGGDAFNGGDGIRLWLQEGTLNIYGGTISGGNGSSTGGDAIFAETGQINIFGGAMNGGSGPNNGDAFARSLYAAGDSVFNIHGGNFGGPLVLNQNSYTNFFGTDFLLSEVDPVESLFYLTGMLADGSALSANVYIWGGAQIAFNNSIQNVPLPPAIGLFGAGFVALIGMSGRRKRGHEKTK
jgi:hypothetical protein